MNRKFLFRICMAFTSVLWHLKTYKSNSTVKQTLALLLVILHFTAMKILGLYEFFDFATNHSSNSNAAVGYTFPLVIGSFIFWFYIMFSYIALCFILPKIEKMANKIIYHLDRNRRTAATSGDLIAFIFVFTNQFGTFILIINYFIHGPYSFKALAQVASIIFYWMIGLVVSLIIVILTIYCNSMAEIVHDEVSHYLTSLRHGRLFDTSRRDNSKTLKLFRFKEFDEPQTSCKCEIKEILFEPFEEKYASARYSSIRHQLLELSGLLEQLLSRTNWLMLLVVVKCTSRIVSLIFSTISLMKKNSPLEQFILTNENLTLLLVLLNMSYRLSREVSSYYPDTNSRTRWSWLTSLISSV